MGGLLTLVFYMNAFTLRIVFQFFYHHLVAYIFLHFSPFSFCFLSFLFPPQEIVMVR